MRWEALLLRFALRALVHCRPPSSPSQPARYNAPLSNATKQTTSRRRAEFLRRLDAQPRHLRRGVVIAAGGAAGANLANAAVAVRVLRRALNSTLPIEVVAFGRAAEAARAAPLAALIEAEARPDAPVFVVDGDGAAFAAAAAADGHDAIGPLLAAAATTAGGGAGGAKRTFATKVFSLAYVTRFKEALLLDADCLPLLDPAALFESGDFKSHGNLFFPDFWHSAWVDASIYERFGLAHPPWRGDAAHRLAESGQLLLNRARHFEVLQWLWLLNRHQGVVYKAMHGDKVGAAATRGGTF